MGVGYTFKPFSYTKEHVNCTKLENPYERKNIIILYFSRGTTVKTFCISSCFFLLCINVYIFRENYSLLIIKRL